MIKNKYKSFYILLSLLIAVQIIWLIFSPGFYFIDDGCHYVYNRHFYLMTDMIISSWARLGRVMLYALPAQTNYRAVQIFAAIIFDLTAILGFKILELKKIPHPEWALLTIGFQPVLFNISYTALAELPTAFLIVLSYYLFIKEKYSGAVIVSSLVFLFRSEYFFVCGLFVIILLFRKKWYTILLALIGPLLWYLTVLIISGSYTEFFRIFTLHNRLPRISSGIDWYYYIISIPKIFGIINTLFFLLAIIILIYKKSIMDWVLPLLIFIGGIAGHTLAALNTFNATCSVGQIRYVSVVGPMFGLLSAIGIGYMFNSINKKYLKYFLSIAVILLLFISGPFMTPFHSKYEIDKICDNITAIRNQNFPDYPVMTDLYQMSVAMDMPYKDYKDFHKMKKSTFNSLDKAFIVWENSLDGTPFTDSDLMLRDIESDSSVKMIDSIHVYADHSNDYPVFKFFRFESKSSKEMMKYLTGEQNAFENTYIKVFVKDRSNENTVR